MLSQNWPEAVISELLYADDLVLMREAIEGLGNKFRKWREAVDNKGLEFHLGKTKVMVIRAITKFWFI